MPMLYLCRRPNVRLGDAPAISLLSGLIPGEKLGQIVRKYIQQ